MTTILSEAEICAKFDVTPAQLDKATRIVDGQSGEIFYQVTSQTVDATYTVRAHSGGHKLSCTCPAGDPQRDKYGMPLSPILPCWHKRAARAHAFEYRQQENLQAEREAKEAARREAEEAKRATAPLNGNAGFSLLKTGTVTMRGYDIRIDRGAGWQNEKAHGYAPLGQLPQEWQDTINDPTVISACIFPSTQRTWQANKRKKLAEYSRETVVA